MNRRASITSNRRHRVITYALRISVAGCGVFLPLAAGLFAYVAFGPFKIVRSRRVRRVH